FAQPELEGLLEARAGTLPTVEVHRGYEVTAIQTADDAVVLEVAVPGGQTGTTQAPHGGGRGGAHNFVRPHLGASVTDLGFFFDWLIVDVVPRQPKVWKPLNIQICDPARPTTLVSGGRGRRRWEFMRLPGESIEELNSTETAWRLLAPWGVTSENATLERHAMYRFQARWVDTWRSRPPLPPRHPPPPTPPFPRHTL